MDSGGVAACWAQGVPLPAGCRIAEESSAWVQGVPLPAVEGVSLRIGSPQRAGGRCFSRQERGVSPSPSGHRDGGQGFALPVAIATCGHCWGPPRGPMGAGPGLTLVPETFAGSILGCAGAWMPHQAERVAMGEEDDRLRFFPPGCEAAAGIRTPAMTCYTS